MENINYKFESGKEITLPPFFKLKDYKYRAVFALKNDCRRIVRLMYAFGINEYCSSIEIYEEDFFDAEGNSRIIPIRAGEYAMAVSSGLAIVMETLTQNLYDTTYGERNLD